MFDEGNQDEDGAGRETEPEEEASYTCQACGEEIVIPVDALAGKLQEYVEDCPVCCHPHVLTVRFDPGFGPSIEARAE